MTDPNQEEKVHSSDFGKMVAEGATALFAGEMASKLIGVLGSLILVRLLVSPAIYAYIAIATVVPGIVMMGDLSGVDSALNRYLSLYKRENNLEGIWSSYWVSNSIKAITGILLSLLAFFLAHPISYLLGKPIVAAYLEIASSLPVVWTLQINVKCTLLSLGRARWYSALQVVNEALLSTAPIIAVILGFGAKGALIALVLANFLYLGIGLAVSTQAIFLETDSRSRKIPYVSTLKKLVKFGFPLGISGSISSFVSQITNLIIGRFVSLNIYGLYSVASSAAALINSVSDPLSSMTFPVYARIRGSEEKELLQKVYERSVKYSTAILLPFALFFIVFAKPFMVLFFGQPYAPAGIYLSVLTFVWLLVGVGWPSSLLSSQGYSKLAGWASIATTAITATMALVIIPTAGLLWYLVAITFAGLPAYLYMIRQSETVLGLRPPFSYVGRLYLALLFSGLASLPVIIIRLPAVLEVFIGIPSVAITFVFFAAICHALDISDAKNLREMISGQPKLLRSFDPLISLLERLIKIMHSEKAKQMMKVS